MKTTPNTDVFLVMRSNSSKRITSLFMSDDKEGFWNEEYMKIKGYKWRFYKLIGIIPPIDKTNNISMMFVILNSDKEFLKL